MKGEVEEVVWEIEGEVGIRGEVVRDIKWEIKGTAGGEKAPDPGAVDTPGSVMLNLGVLALLEGSHIFHDYPGVILTSYH